jgi:FixJ family two-component response regulator
MIAQHSISHDVILESAVTGNSPLVFVVDDDESVRHAMRRLMKSVGFRVKTFASAEEYLESGRQEAPTCLVLDVRMPGKSGLELQEELAASGSSLPIIFITAYDNGEVQSRAMKANAVAFLRKPFEDQALLDAIQKAFNRGAPGERVASDAV